MKNWYTDENLCLMEEPLPVLFSSTWLKPLLFDLLEDLEDWEDWERKKDLRCERST